MKFAGNFITLCADFTYPVALKASHEFLILLRLGRVLLPPLTQGLKPDQQQWRAQALCSIGMVVEVVSPPGKVLRTMRVLMWIHDPAVGGQVHYVILFVDGDSL